MEAENPTTEQIARLEQFFKKMHRIPSDDDDSGDDNIFGEYWEVEKPEELEEWSIGLVPMTDSLQFCHKFKNAPHFFTFSADEKIKDVSYSDGLLNISCQTTVEPSYMFTLCVAHKTSSFNISHFLSTLENSSYEPLLQSLENQVDRGIWGSEQKRLSAKVLVSKIREILITLASETSLLQNDTRRLTPIDSRVRRIVDGQASEGSVPPSGSRTTLRPRTPASATRRAATLNAAPSTSLSKRSSQLAIPQITAPRDDIPASLDVGEETDFTSAKEMFESFWGECSDCFIFAIDERKDVNINQLDLAPKHWVIRELEPKGVKLTAHYLSHMPDLTTRQTLCIMPQNMTEKPTTWDAIKDGKFWIINGQHSVEASKVLQSSGLAEDRLSKLRVWGAFVVWTKDETLLRRISKFYNRCNHFGMFQPTWGTNVIGARHIWEKLGRPAPTKEATALGKRVKKARLKKNVVNEKNWKVFLEAVQEKFSSIEINATRKNMRSSSSKSRKVDDVLYIQNEIKIITADDSTFQLWSEVISAHSTGELIDPESMKKFKEIKGWKPERDGHINREFFKFMGNMSSEDHRKLALHLLNRSGEKRRQAYPKVTMKKVSAVLESCYSSKDWIERRKRKQLVRKELHLLEPGLHLFSASGDFRQESWKKFKADFNITSATMRVLTEAPGEDFFSLGKLVCNKNKAIEEISPYAKAVLKHFLKTKKNFQKPLGRAFMRAFDVVANRMRPWPERRWVDNKADLSLAVLDFRQVTHFQSAKDYTIKKPFFESFMAVMSKQSAPGLTDPPAWVWICGDKVATTQIVHFAQEKMSSKYNLVYSDYVPCQNERLEDKAANNKAAKAKVALILLLKKGSRVADMGKKIPIEFIAPDDKSYQKPGKYNELQYRLSSSEFRMEFYLRLIHLLCKPGDTIFSALGGGKLLCAAMMNSMTFFTICFSEDGEDFKRLVSLSKNLDMLDFAHNAYVVDEAKYPRKVKDGRDSGARGKRKVSEAVDLESDEDVDVDVDEQVQSPTHESSPLREHSSAGDDMECMETSLPTGPSAMEVDVDVPVEGDYRMLQRERAERAASSLRFFAEPADFERPSSLALPESATFSRRRVDRVRVDRGIARILEDQSSLGARPVDGLSQQTPSSSAQLPSASQSPVASEEAANSQMTFMMKVLEKQTEQFKDMQLQMQREMQRENREFQREVREESRNLMAAVPDLIAQTVSRMGIAFNVQPLNAIEGGPVLEKQLLIADCSTSPKSSDSQLPCPTEQEQTGPSQASVEVIVTPAATLPGPIDRLVHVISQEGVSPSVDDSAVTVHAVNAMDVSTAAASPAHSNRLDPLEDPSASVDMSGDNLDLSNYDAGESSRPQASGSNKEFHAASLSVSIPVSYNLLSSRWLNVVLDLNGVLCVCEERRFMPRGQKFAVGVGPHSATVPSIVGPKAVFVRPDCTQFLRAVSEIADITVWSSMRRRTVEELCIYLFRNVQPPVNILGQESCDRILLRDSRGSVRAKKLAGTSKDIFLKPLSKRLFPHFLGRYSAQNTIIIDDSPVKHILNSKANVVIPQPWSHLGGGVQDSYLMRELFPWLQELHKNQELGIEMYRSLSDHGRPMIYDDPTDSSFQDTMEAISESERAGFQYSV